MSKHDTIIKNLCVLTRRRSFDKAVEGWTVKHLIALPRRQQQACELCGTRFRKGATVQHRQSKATIVVGRNCFRTLEARKFQEPFNTRKAKKYMFSALRSHYGPLVDPGNWRRWVQTNVPKSLMQTAADLFMFGAIEDSDKLQKLIRFHDKKRLFLRNALLTDPKTLERALGVKIAKYITIAEGRQLSKKGQSAFSVLKFKSTASAYLRKNLLPYIKEDYELTLLWPCLRPIEKRAVAALVALDDKAAKNNEPIVSEDIAKSWPRPRKAPMFVWNEKVGLGFVAEGDVFNGQKASIWLWRSEKYKLYNLSRWHGVIGCSQEDVKKLETLAFYTESPVLRY